MSAEVCPACERASVLVASLGCVHRDGSNNLRCWRWLDRQKSLAADRRRNSAAPYAGYISADRKREREVSCPRTGKPLRIAMAVILRAQKAVR